jgi:alkylation response protein AidB-like acyl-CoA dehydrogenase
MMFVLEHLAGLPALAKLDGFQQADVATTKGLLEEAGRFFSEVVAPLNRIGDEQGSRLEADGTVRTPTGFREAWSKFVAAGWAGVHLPEEYGGGGLPFSIGFALQEMFKTANVAFALAPMLTQSAIEAIEQHGSVEQRNLYLPMMVSGRWTGTMVLTEPQAGSDLGQLTTRAERQPDGTYRLFGQKIFITWGDHDLAENVIHLVLARTPDAPAGTKGISLFIVPKFLVEADGKVGARNDLQVLSLEHKLGIHASPTCVMSFGENGEGAVGYLVGEEHTGLASMFTMMNIARLGVGIEGLGAAESAYQRATAFARERLQGRPPGGTGTSPIIAHPDVRRMLLTMRAEVEAMRALLYVVASQVDFEQWAAEPAERERAGTILSLLTPVAKAWCTDLGVEVASLGIQVHGGMGYVEETGAAQILRDARIAPIYEGTNGIQAMDLVMRKLPQADGKGMRDILDEVAATASRLGNETGWELEAAALTSAAAAVAVATDHMLEVLPDHPADALAGASPYLRMVGFTLGGWVMARSALVCMRTPDLAQDEEFRRAKLTIARFYLGQLLPQAGSLLPAATAGAEILFDMEP